MIPSQVAGKLLRSGAASGGNNGDNGNGEDLNVLEQFQPNAHNGGMTPPHITATITPSPSYHQQTEEGETESPLLSLTMWGMRWAVLFLHLPPPSMTP